MDKIIIEGLRLFAYHGVNPEEKDMGQYFLLDITAFLNLEAACTFDEIGDTVSYAKIIKSASAAFLAEKNNLLERAAQRTAEALLVEFPGIQSVTVKLSKPDAPIKADFKCVAVEITRERKSPEQ